MIPGFIPPHQAVGIVPFGNKIPESQGATAEADSNMVTYIQSCLKVAAVKRSSRLLQIFPVAKRIFLPCHVNNAFRLKAIDN